MGATTSNSASTANSNDISSLKVSISTLKTKVDNFSASNVDYTQLAGNITSTSDYLKKISDAIIAQPSKLSDTIVPGIIANATFANSINNSITANQTFTRDVANKITSDPTLKAILKGDKGEPGNIGSLAALKSNLFTSKLDGALFPATIWCADTKICQIPVGNTGLKIGSWIIEEHTNGNLHIHNGNIEDWKARLTPDGILYGKKLAGDSFTSKNWSVEQYSNGNLHIHNGNVNDWKTAITPDGTLYGKINVKTSDSDFVRSNREYSIRANHPGNDGDWRFISRRDNWLDNDGKRATFVNGRGDYEKMVFEPF
jgi:hypothetical protein